MMMKKFDASDLRSAARLYAIFILARSDASKFKSLKEAKRFSRYPQTFANLRPSRKTKIC